GTGAGSGPEFIRRLSELWKEQSSLAGRQEHPALDRIVCCQSASDLKRWIGIAGSATRDVSGLGRLSLARYVNRRRLRRFLQASGTTVDDALMRDFLARAVLETRLRSLRAETAKIYGALGFFLFCNAAALSSFLRAWLSNISILSVSFPCSLKSSRLAASALVLIILPRPNSWFDFIWQSLFQSLQSGLLACFRGDLLI
ncbi:MAG TPA: hypothetical protein VLR90_03220, partial [Blastocatellia bacterium]|nr:hypothetical protein [Blastocatellia bacterium]